MGDYEYLAGYFDADGYLGFSYGGWDRKIAPQRGWLYPQMQVGGVVCAPLDLFQETFGGALRLRHVRPHEQPMGLWTMSGRHKVQRALVAMLPYLRVKKAQAQLVLRCFRECYRDRGTWPRLTAHEVERRVGYKHLLRQMKRGDIDPHEARWS